MKMNTIKLNIDKYESMLKELGVLKTENEELKKRLLTSYNSDYAKCGCGEKATVLLCNKCFRKDIVETQDYPDFA